VQNFEKLDIHLSDELGGSAGEDAAEKLAQEMSEEVESLELPRPGARPVEQHIPVIGIYATRDEELDDWADDFDLGTDASSQVTGPQPHTRRSKEFKKLRLDTVTGPRFEELSARLLTPMEKEGYNLKALEANPECLNMVLFKSKVWRLDLLDDDVMKARREHARSVMEWKVVCAKICGSASQLVLEKLKLCKLLNEASDTAASLPILGEIVGTASDVGDDTLLCEAMLQKAEALCISCQNLEAISVFDELVAFSEKSNCAMKEWYANFGRYSSAMLQFETKDGEKLEALSDYIIDAFDSIRTVTPKRVLDGAFLLLSKEIVLSLIQISEHLSGSYLVDTAHLIVDYATTFARIFYPSLRQKAESVRAKIEETIKTLNEAMEISPSTKTDTIDIEDWDAELEEELQLQIRPLDPMTDLGKETTFDGDNNYSKLLEREVHLFVQKAVLPISKQQVRQKFYPKPTQPYSIGKLRGPEKLELYLKNCVRSTVFTSIQPIKLQEVTRRVADPLGKSPQDVDPLREFAIKINYVEKFTKKWAALHLATIWRVQFTNRIGEHKSQMRQLILQ